MIRIPSPEDYPTAEQLVVNRVIERIVEQTFELQYYKSRLTSKSSVEMTCRLLPVAIAEFMGLVGLKIENTDEGRLHGVRPYVRQAVDAITAKGWDVRYEVVIRDPKQPWYAYYMITIKFKV